MLSPQVIERKCKAYNPTSSQLDSDQVMSMISQEAVLDNTGSVVRKSQSTQFGAYIFRCTNCDARDLRVPEKFRFRSIRCPRCQFTNSIRINTIFVDVGGATNNSAFKQLLATTGDNVLTIVSNSLFSVRLFLKFTHLEYHRLVLLADPLPRQVDTNPIFSNELKILVAQVEELDHIQLVLLRINVSYADVKLLHQRLDPQEVELLFFFVHLLIR
jgi:hypothetical protein